MFRMTLLLSAAALSGSVVSASASVQTLQLIFYFHNPATNATFVYSDSLTSDNPVIDIAVLDVGGSGLVITNKRAEATNGSTLGDLLAVAARLLALSQVRLDVVSRLG